MKDFTVGKRLSQNGPASSIKQRLARLEDRRAQRKTLKTLCERKAASVCGNRDSAFLEKVAESNMVAARARMDAGYSDIEVMEIEVEFKRQSSHGPLNYYMTKEDQLNRNQKI